MDAGARTSSRSRSIPTGPCPATSRRRRGTAPPRLRSVDLDLLWKQAFGSQLVDGVIGVDDLVAHALQQLARGDASGREEDVVARAEVVDAQDLVRLMAFLHGEGAL